MSTRCVVVLAKAPVPGFAKTRLIPALGPHGAAKLAEQLLQHALAQACGAGANRVLLCAAPERTHPAFARWNADGAVQLIDQGGGDLGARMHRALLHALARYQRVLLMGTDAPALSSEVLRHAFETLADPPAHSAADTVDAVFVPALDGGYALVGLRRPCPPFFTDMPWSTPQVMAITRQRAAQAGWRIKELPAVADIDEPQDLAHLPTGWACWPTGSPMHKPEPTPNLSKHHP